MKTNLELTITHLYPDYMNLYGDMGNIITLKRRANLRGITVRIKNIGINDNLKENETDIYFFGGGQDAQQNFISNDLLKYKSKTIFKDLENNVVMLAICGGYQLLGRFYMNGKGKKSKGIGFFPIETIAPEPEVNSRAIGNIITKIKDKKTLKEIKQIYKYPIDYDTLETLVGFENHSGRTRLLDRSIIQLGKVLYGVGDSEKQGFEGLRLNNAFGTYMHGSFLPKNPHIADLLIYLALKRKYSKKLELKTLDDKLEWLAHDFILKKFKK